jgi:hypothetical protein
MIFGGICDVNIQSDKFKRSMNEHIHGSMHKELSVIQLQMNTYAFGLFWDDLKKKKICIFVKNYKQGRKMLMEK